MFGEPVDLDDTIDIVEVTCLSASVPVIFHLINITGDEPFYCYECEQRYKTYKLEGQVDDYHSTKFIGSISIRDMRDCIIDKMSKR